MGIVMEMLMFNGSVQFDEDGLLICIGDMDEDFGCEDNKIIDGSGFGFFLLEDIFFNIIFEFVFQLVFLNLLNFIYVGFLSFMVSVLGEEDVIEWVGLVMLLMEFGKSVILMFYFKNESFFSQYIYVFFIMDFVMGKKVMYQLIVMKLSEGDEFGKCWEVYLYGGISGGSFMFYEIIGNGFLKFQEGMVEFKGFFVSFIFENFFLIFLEKIYMSMEVVLMSFKFFIFIYLLKESFVIKVKEGRIDYYISVFFGIEDELVSIRIMSSEYDLIFEFYVMKDIWLLFIGFIDSSDDGMVDWIFEVRDRNYELKDEFGSFFRDGNVIVENIQLGKKVSFRIENFYSFVLWRKFCFWMMNWIECFLVKSNFWVDVSEGMSIEKDVDFYLVVVVEDVFVKENGDYVEGEIQFFLWVYGMIWFDGKVWLINYSFIYIFGYLIGYWVEVEDNSRFLYYDDRMMGFFNMFFVNGYLIFVMFIDEVKKYKIIVFEIVGWDRDEFGKYVIKMVGYLMDFVVGMVIGEIGMVVDYVYKGVIWMNWLVMGQSGDEFWGSVFNWFVGVEFDKVGNVVYVFYFNEVDFIRGYCVIVELRDGNMCVIYVIYEVEVLRFFKYDNFKVEFLEVDFMKDIEIGDDEYYYYVRVCVGFESFGEIEGFYNVEVNVLVLVGYVYFYLVSLSEGVIFNCQFCLVLKFFYKYFSGNEFFLKFGLVMLECDDVRVLFFYMEYLGWEEDVGKWGNDDDLMGNVGIMIVFDDDYFDWDVILGILSKYWLLDFDVCGVLGGCFKVW